MNTNFMSFFKKHIRVSAIILIFMFLILLPQFNFCSSKQEMLTEIENITVTYPNGGEELAKGSSIVIKWDSTIADSNNVTEDKNNTNNDNNSNNNNNDSNVTYSTFRDGDTTQSNGINPVNTETQGDTIPDEVMINLAKEIERINKTINLSSIGLDCSFMTSGVFPVIAIVVGSAAVVGGIIVLIVVGIKDSNSNDYRNHINIDLYENDNFLFTIGHRRENSGSFDWNIPEKVSGRDFKIKVSSSINSEIFDFSDSTFSIIDEALINNEDGSTNEDENSSDNNDINSDTDNNNTNANSTNSTNNSENDNVETETTESSNVSNEFVLNNYDDSSILITESSKHTTILDNDENINFNQLPTNLKHYVYLNLQSVTDKIEELPENKSRKIDKVKNRYIEEYYRNTPKDRELIRMLLDGTLNDNLHLYDEVDEIVMGLDGIDKKTRRPSSLAMLMKVSSIYGIVSRLEESVKHKKTVINGYDVYTSDEESTIIISDYVIGATTSGKEEELIESYNNPHNRTDIINYSEDSDLFCADFDVDGFESITDYLGLDSFNINIDDFDSVNLTVSEINNAITVNINGVTDEVITARNYQQSLNNTLNVYRSNLQKLQSNARNNSNIVRNISNVLDTLTIEEVDSSLCIEFQIELK